MKSVAAKTYSPILLLVGNDQRPPKQSVHSIQYTATSTNNENQQAQKLKEAEAPAKFSQYLLVISPRMARLFSCIDSLLDVRHINLTWRETGTKCRSRSRKFSGGFARAVALQQRLSNTEFMACINMYNGIYYQQRDLMAEQSRMVRGTVKEGTH
ncbi:hypothetical protein N7G274_003996 [Stereocaulon virgatum]|uniref:Uncharacterized protein n=1 Tax=Stereocaulon virgatum TaxID=373712 RepID=A0ABR4AHP8_9LECA